MMLFTLSVNRNTSTSIENMPLSTQSPRNNNFVLKYKVMIEYKKLLWQSSLVDYFLKHVNEVEILTMDVPHNDHWLLHSYDILLTLYINIAYRQFSNLQKTLVTSLINLTNSVLAMLPSSKSHCLIFARSGMLGVPINKGWFKILTMRWESYLGLGTSHCNSEVFRVGL